MGARHEESFQQLVKHMGFDKTDKLFTELQKIQNQQMFPPPPSFFAKGGVGTNVGGGSSFPTLPPIIDLGLQGALIVIQLGKSSAHFQKLRLQELGTPINISFAGLIKDRSILFTLDITNQTAITSPINFPPNLYNLPQIPTEIGKRYTLTIIGFRNATEERYYVINAGDSATIAHTTTNNIFTGTNVFNNTSTFNGTTTFNNDVNFADLAAFHDDVIFYRNVTFAGIGFENRFTNRTVFQMDSTFAGRNVQFLYPTHVETNAFWSFTGETWVTTLDVGTLRYDFGVTTISRSGPLINPTLLFNMGWASDTARARFYYKPAPLSDDSYVDVFLDIDSSTYNALMVMFAPAKLGQVFHAKGFLPADYGTWKVRTDFRFIDRTNLDDITSSIIRHSIYVPNANPYNPIRSRLEFAVLGGGTVDDVMFIEDEGVVIQPNKSLFLLENGNVTLVNGEFRMSAGDVLIRSGGIERNLSHLFQVGGENVGDGAGKVHLDTVGSTLRFRSIKAGANITVTNNPLDITIAATAEAGANRYLSNLLSETAINQHLLPNADSTRDLGGANFYWRRLWVGTIQVGSPSSLITSSNDGLMLRVDTGDPIRINTGAAEIFEFLESELIMNGNALWDVGTITIRNAKNIVIGTATGTKIGTSTTQKIGFWNATPVVRQSSAALTNNVASGGTTDVISNYTDLVDYSADAATIRNNFFQLARKVKEIGDALRTCGILG